MLSITWGFAKEHGLFEIEIGRSCGRTHIGMAFDHDEREVGVSYHTRFGCIALTYFAVAPGSQDALVAELNAILERSGNIPIRVSITSVFDQDERRN